MLYEREVFDLVRNSLDSGKSEKTIVATLAANDFTKDEATTIVRAVIEDRKSRDAARPSRSFSTSFPSHPLDKGTDEVDSDL